VQVAWTPHLRALLTIAAGALFLYFAPSGQAYRSDEVWSLRTVSLPHPAMMEQIRKDIHPPLYYWLLAGWTRAAGSGEVPVRALSILLCLAAALAVYAAAREWSGAGGGVLAAALFVTSPLSGLASQLARMYALLALGAALSTLGFLRLSRHERARPADWAIYVAANIAGTFTHVWFFFLLFAQACAHVALSRRARTGRMAAAAALSLAPYGALWLPALVEQARRSGTALAWVPRPTAGDLAQTALFLGGVFLACVPFLRPWWKGRGPEVKHAALPALVAAFSVLVPFAVSFWKPMFWPRFTVIALPAFCIAVAGWAPVRSRFRLETSLVAAACALSVTLSLYASRCDSRRTAEYLAKNARAGDLVVFTSLSRLPIDYYWDRIQPDRRVEERSFPAEIDQHPGFEGAIHTAEARSRLQGEAARLTTEIRARRGARVFFLHGMWPETDAILKEKLDGRFARLDGLGLECMSLGSYFQYVAAYSCGP
jgi:hypothetical protein